MRADGKRIKDESAIMSAVPYIMPHRYDAMNMITEYADMDRMREYIHAKRKEGIRISYMALILAAYFKAYREFPKINRFVMHHHVYQRNHFCVSFAMLKDRADGTPDETTLKVFFEDDDDVISINQKIEDAIEKNQNAEFDNKTDKFANFMFSIPLLPTLVVGLARLLDNLGLLPRSIIDLSPFHTSLFITNLASINTSHIFHHCYDFGTTGIFICMGKPVPDYINGHFDKHIMPLSVVMDERFCTGHDFAVFYAAFRRYLRHPERMERGYQGTTEETEE